MVSSLCWQVYFYLNTYFVTVTLVCSFCASLPGPATFVGTWMKIQALKDWKYLGKMRLYWKKDTDFCLNNTAWQLLTHITLYLSLLVIRRGFRDNKKNENVIHNSVLFYIRDLGICDLCYPRRSWNQSTPVGYWGTQVLWNVLDRQSSQQPYESVPVTSLAWY